MHTFLVILGVVAGIVVGLVVLVVIAVANIGDKWEQ